MVQICPGAAAQTLLLHGPEASMLGCCVDGWDQACDVLYTDLMSLMYPDDNTHSLMLHPSCFDYQLRFNISSASACCMQSNYNVRIRFGFANAVASTSPAADFACVSATTMCIMNPHATKLMFIPHV